MNRDIWEEPMPGTMVMGRPELRCKLRRHRATVQGLSRSSYAESQEEKHRVLNSLRKQ